MSVCAHSDASTSEKLERPDFPLTEQKIAVD
jgi:hypothetical protein